MRQISLAILLLFSGAVFAQTTDEKLANQFFSDGEYEKAVGLYKKLYKRHNRSNYIYDNYLNSLIALEDKKGSINLVNKQIKQYPNGFYYQVDLGYVYSVFNDENEANEHFEKLIKKASKSRNDVLVLAQSFMRRKMPDYALKSYEKGAQVQGVMSYWPQLSSMYRFDNQLTKLVDLSLDVILQDETQLNRVFGNLDKVLEDPEKSEYLQSETLRLIQKNPGYGVLDDLLLRVYFQQKKYSAAFRQCIAIDKRNGLEGEKILGFAESCISLKQYEHSIKAYQYIIDEGQDGLYYEKSQMGLLNASYLDLSSAFDPDISRAKSLVSMFDSYLRNNQITYKNAPVVKRLAELNLYYTKDIARSVHLLEKIIVVPRLQGSFVAECKLLLGDAYLIQNNIWDAKIMYGQVDKLYKEDALGQEAKYRAARLSYFTGDFDWASSQLDVLKSATTQLISNNAIELSLLIQDNTGLDSTQDAMKEYANASFLLFQNKIDECQAVLNMLPFNYPNHELHDEVFFLQAQLEQKKHNYDKALVYYKKVYENYGDDILADNALFQAAEILLFGLDEKDLAQSLYETLLLDYNSSLFAVEARKKFYALKEGKTKEELFFEGILN